MTDARESRSEQTVATDERQTFATTPHVDRRDRSQSLLVWVGIVAGVVFIVAVVFFSGFFVGRATNADSYGGYHHGGMTGPGWMMRPGWMMGPQGPWPGPPTTTTAPRP
ncbi:hypothetical protein CQY20_02045 [Mycolicibacterium agri]|uniref:Uncharacterized protein n=1 Tax=Mycolicibacterium agri TaxID=36811 RepID=A0A2A7NG04_MYCAG|nr:hypothetical protein [Mycolicibacterium agri]PEG42790.1 hypothetical protein CQY20_02045 [Mycolicibacterium agri]